MSKLPAKASDRTKALVRAMAMDIGKEVVSRIRIMYPAAIAACPSTFPLSVRNCIHNEIMAAIEITDEGRIIARLDDRKKFRREQVAFYNKIRRAK